MMADIPGHVRFCLQTGKLASLAILVSGGIVLQVLACALYNNWWPMLTLITWVNITKFLTGASAVGSIAIPVILKHAGVIGWGALALGLSSFFVFVLAILCYIRMGDEDSSYSFL